MIMTPPPRAAPPSLAALLTVFLCLLVAPPLASADTIIMDSNATLSHYLCDEGFSTFQPNTTILLNPGTYVLEDGPMCRIENSTDLSIMGSGDPENPTTIVCQGNEAIFRGIVFANITNLRIENLRMENCGTEVPSDLPELTYSTFTYFGPGQKAVLLFTHCLNLYMEGVTINRSFGLAIVGINVLGSVELDNVTVQNTDNDRHPLCNGVAADLSCSGSGISFVYSDNYYTDDMGENVTLSIIRSLFVNNTNRSPYTYFLPLYLNVRSAFQSIPIILSGAAGLAVYSSQKDFFVNFTLSGSTVENCGGELGGVLLFNYNTARNTRYHVWNSNIRHNTVIGAIRGAGLLLALTIYLDRLGQFPSYPNDPFDVMLVEGSSFYGNSGDQGAGIYLHVTPQNISEFSVTVRNTTFTKNVANVGSAMAAAGIDTTFVSKSVSVLLEDVEANKNTFPEALAIGTDTIANSGVFVFVNIHNVTITGTPGFGSKFYNNTPGVFVVAGSNIQLRGHVKFEDNYAFNGGAISVYDSTKIFLHEGSDIFFARNRALQLGGAIYGNALGTGIADACMMQVIGPSLIYNPRDAGVLNLTLTFVNNTAGEAGNSIYGNPIYGCVYLPESSVQHTVVLNNEGELYSAIFNFKSTVDNGIQELSSVPQRLCYCGDNTEFSEEFCGTTTTGQYIASIHTFPGKEFTVNLIPVDGAIAPVSSLLYAEIESNSKDDLRFGPAQSIRRLNGAGCTAVSFALYGTGDTTASVFLYTSSGGIPVIVNLTIGSCPPGFTLELNSDGLLQCECEPFVTDHIETTCNDTTYTILRPENAWIGVQSSGAKSEVAYVQTCPINYCNDYVTEVDLRIEDQLCDTGRAGVLCGECSSSLSVVFGSAKCEKCSSLWLLTIPLYGIAGIFLVFVLFALDLTVTKSTIIGLIFYANIVSVNANIFFRGTGQGFLFVFVSLLNLELGFPVCFYNGMNEIAKIGFQFIFPAYLLVLCGAIIYLSRWSSRMQKITASSGVAVLATLIYLSYSKILRTVIDILSFATLKSPGESRLVWLFDGNVEYFKGVHIFLGTVAFVVILVLIVPYTVSLSLVVLIQRRSRRIRLKPLIDVYVASFKDKWRFWFGIRLFVLTIMCVLYAALGTDDPSLALMFQLFVVVVFAISQAYLQPFRNIAVELLDMSFILNFVILALATSHIIDDSHNEDRQKQAVSAMISVAFVVFLGIIAYHMLIQLRKIEKFRKATDDLCAMVKEKLKVGSYKLHGSKQKAPALAATQKPTVSTMDFNMDEVSTEPNSTGTPSAEHSTAGSDRQTGTSSEVSFTNAIMATPEEPRLHTKTFSRFRESILEHI